MALSTPTSKGLPKFLKVSGSPGRASTVPSNSAVVVGPSRKLTQEDQDKVDEDDEREAMQNLIQTWLERLQLISVITTFFASTESGMLGKSLPSGGDVLPIVGQVTNVCFMCALVVHAFASVISFLGAFYLIRYKLEVAERDEEEVEHEMIDSPISISSDPIKRVSSTSQSSGLRNTTNEARGRVTVKTDPGAPIIWSSNPRLVQVGPFRTKAPIELLSRCHSLCVLLTFLGFLLAIMGLMTFSWDRLPLSIGVGASVALGFCLTAGASILIFPFTKIPNHLRS